MRPEGVDYPVARARTSPVNWRCAGLSSRSVLNELRRPPPRPRACARLKRRPRDFHREKAVSVNRTVPLRKGDVDIGTFASIDSPPDVETNRRSRGIAR